MKNIKKILTHITGRFGWTSSSYYLLSGFLLTIFLIMYIWWPLVVEYLASYNPNYPLWKQVDWLLIIIFGFMSLMIMTGADIKNDLPKIVIGLIGGLVIESWGTQTELWTYYTNERPPLWIIPAWPIASLSTDRLYHMVASRLKGMSDSTFKVLHWIILPLFFLIMVQFSAPTWDKYLTITAWMLVAFLILTPTNVRGTVLIFIAGSGLGYFLELWGTTREAWTYYTFETPPLFAVLAHGFAALAFWRALRLYKFVMPILIEFISKRNVVY